MEKLKAFGLYISSQSWIQHLITTTINIDVGGVVCTTVSREVDTGVGGVHCVIVGGIVEADVGGVDGIIVWRSRHYY